MLFIEEASAIHQKISINNPFYFFLLPYTLQDEIQHHNISLSGLLTAGPSAAHFGALTLFLLWICVCVCVACLLLNALCYLNQHHSSFLCNWINFALLASFSTLSKLVNGLPAEKRTVPFLSEKYDEDWTKMFWWTFILTPFSLLVLNASSCVCVWLKSCSVF